MQPERHNVKNWRAEHKRVVKVLQSKLAGSNSCADLIDGYEAILRAIWDFNRRLLGDAGAKAVLTRAIHLAAQQTFLVGIIRVGDGGAEFKEFRQYVTKEGCTAADVMDALVQLGVTIFQTLSELAGDALTEPLIRRLEEQ